ncbi:MAG: glycosyltransferase family 4 protein [Candidatus Hydrogenedentota bacterium]
MSPIRIAYLSTRDVNDPQSHGHYYMAKALAKHVGEVYPILLSEGRRPALWRRARRRLGRAMASAKPVSPLTYSKRLSAKAEELIKGGSYDVLFLPHGSHIAAHLNTGVPLVYASDATFRRMHGYNPGFSGLSERRVQEEEQVACLATNRAQLIVHPTEWAALSSVGDYYAEPSKVTVIPSGANIEGDTPTFDNLVAAKFSREGVCRLLLVGNDWNLKGGAIAVETLRNLRAMGIEAQLTICGCRPPAPLRDTNINIIPWLKKSNATSRARLHQLYATSHFYLAPSRAECFGLAICEAHAFATPVIASNTGGVPEAVAHGETGLTLPWDASPTDYANAIAAIWRNPQQHTAMMEQAKRRYERRLNWDVWALELGQTMQHVLGLQPMVTSGCNSAP